MTDERLEQIKYTARELGLSQLGGLAAQELIDALESERRWAKHCFREWSRWAFGGTSDGESVSDDQARKEFEGATNT